MTTFDTALLSTAENYRLMINLIVPRPIAWVSSQGVDGSKNLAPFSFFTGVSSNPPSVAISISTKPDGKKKDTLKNIEETKQFVINGAPVALAEKLVATAAEYPYGVDEMAKIGLTPEKSERVKPERVKECHYHLECELMQIVTIGESAPGASSLIIGKILLFALDPSFFPDGRPDYKTLQPLARLGGISYASLGEAFQIAVPKL